MLEPFALFAALLFAFILDYVVGDPRWLPHPVRLIGRGVNRLEGFFLHTCRSPRSRKAAGAAMTVLLVGAALALTVLAIYYGYRLHFWIGFSLAVYLLYSMLSMKDMVGHVMEVYEALQEGDLDGARTRVGFLVSRDTADLSEEGVAKAALESLFENTADGVVAPLFYGALGGAPLAVLYKVVNTLDSMIGYKNERYYYLGWAAARTDDLLSYLPARLTALAFIGSGLFGGNNWRKGWLVLLQDRKKHESPNSAWPEAAAAGVMDLRLGGADYYGGLELNRPVLNESGRDPRRSDLLQGLALFRRTTIMALWGALLLALLAGWCWGILL